MTTTKRKYAVVAKTELDNENPVSNGKRMETRAKKAKAKKTSIDNETPTLSRWPGDVSNTFQQYTNKIITQNNSNANFCDLPDELILTIMTYLNKASITIFMQTCRRYRAIGNHPRLWHRVDMSSKRVNSEQLNSLLKRGIITLKMHQTTIQDTNMIRFVPSLLCHLDLTSANMSMELLANLLGSCTLLRKLSLESMPLNYQVIQKMVLNGRLDTLNLAMCSGLTKDSCKLITNKLTSLHCLNIAWTDLNAENIRHICETLPRSMEYLNLSGHRYSLTDDCIQALVRRVPHLRVLDVSDSVSITDQSIVAIRQHSRALVQLSISRCYLLTSPVLLTLKVLTSFTELNIFGTLAPIPLEQLRQDFGARIHLNKSPLSTIARPTTGIYRTSIWGLRTRL